MVKCEYCGKEHDGSYGSGRFCCASCARKYSGKFIRKTKIIKCQNCGKEFEVSVHSPTKYCDNCRYIKKLNYKYIKDINKYKYINNIKNSNLPEEIKQYYINQHFNINLEEQQDLYNKILKMNYYPSKIHKKDKTIIRFISSKGIAKLQDAGKKSSKTQSEIRRSKNEIEFCKLCEKYFNDVIHNKQIFNGWDADIILPNEKIAILWNGIWHYKKITRKHSVKQVQNRDAIKINEIKNCGYTPYIIKDMGKYNKNFVKEQFEIFLNKFYSKDKNVKYQTCNHNK